MKPTRMFALVNRHGEIIEVSRRAKDCRNYAQAVSERNWQHLYRQGCRVIPVIVRPA